MDKYMETALQRRMERTVQALQKNGFSADIVCSVEALHEKMREILPAGSSCAVGGSMTLFETGVIDLLRSGGYEFYDRYAPGVDVEEIHHKALGCDVYVTGSNAITEDGKLYNIDGTGNRVAAMIYGPQKVVVVAGANKIVGDIAAARLRAKETAAPLNALRLSKKTPCVQTGICANCASPDRICCTETVLERQRPERAGRIHVLLLPGSYGY